MEITEGVKIELDSDDIDKIITEWVEKKMAERGCEITSSKKDSHYLDVTYYGKNQASN